MNTLRFSYSNTTLPSPSFWVDVATYTLENRMVTVCDGDDYRFGFNGMEKDNQVKGVGNSLDFGERIYDSRLGRWMSLDPLQAKYPNLSPYNFVANSPIMFVDPDGRIIVNAGKTDNDKARINGTIENLKTDDAILYNVAQTAKIVNGELMWKGSKNYNEEDYATGVDVTFNITIENLDDRTPKEDAEMSEYNPNKINFVSDKALDGDCKLDSKSYRGGVTKDEKGNVIFTYWDVDENGNGSTKTVDLNGTNSVSPLLSDKVRIGIDGTPIFNIRIDDILMWNRSDESVVRHELGHGIGGMFYWLNTLYVNEKYGENNEGGHTSDNMGGQIAEEFENRNYEEIEKRSRDTQE